MKLAAGIRTQDGVSTSRNTPKKVIRWIAGQKEVCYENQLRLLNIQQLPLFLQLNNIMLTVKLLTDRNEIIRMPELHNSDGRAKEILIHKKKRQQKRPGYIFSSDNAVFSMGFTNTLRTTISRKNRVIILMCQQKNSVTNTCTWGSFCFPPLQNFTNEKLVHIIRLL